MELANHAAGLEAQERSPNRVDKSVLTLMEARRLRDKDHLKADPAFLRALQGPRAGEVGQVIEWRGADEAKRFISEAIARARKDGQG